MRNFPHVNSESSLTKSFEWVSLVAQIHVQTNRFSQDRSTFTRVQRLVGPLPDWDQNAGRRAALSTQVNCLSPKWLTASECDWVISQMPTAESAALSIWISQSLTDLLDSAWLLILNFCSASLLSMVTGSWLSPLGTTTGPLSDFTPWGTPYAVELGNLRFGRSKVDSLNLWKSWIAINCNKDIVSSNFTKINAYLVPRTIGQKSHLKRFKGRLGRGNLTRNTTFHNRMN